MLAMQNQSESAGSPAKLNPSRSAQNLTSNKLELPPKSKPDKQPQQPLTTPQKYYPGFSPPSSASNNNSSAAFRFGTPDTRASYSERRPAAVRPTAHNHPPAKTSSPRNADEKCARSMSVSLASLSRSNGSLSAEQDSAKAAKLSCPPASTPRNNAPAPTPSTSNKRREFGSHGSLDALTNGPERENFFALLRDLGAQSSSSNGSSTGSREASRCSPERDVDSKPVGCAPSRLAELLRPNFSRGTTLHVHSTSDTMSSTSSSSMGPVSLSLVQSVPNRSATLPPESCSPKPRSKFQRFWEKEKPKEKSHPQTSESAAPNPTSRSASEPSIFKRLRAGSNQKATPVNGLAFSAAPDCDNTVDRLGTDASDAEARLDDRLRRKAFIHYDCQSMSVNLGYAARLRGLLAQRRNTTTGASAASMAAAAAAGSNNKTKNFAPSSNKNAKQQLQQQNSAAPVLQQHVKTEADETDEGDSKTNELVLSCPYFRNELGGEPEWSLGLSRNNNSSENGWPQVLHKPSAAYGVAVLEFPVGQTHWKHGICPYQRQPSLLERGDQGAYYYGTHFYGQDHQNWFGLDENLGPVAISVRREKAVGDEDSQSDKDVYAYRLIIRSSELATCRGTVLEEAIPTLKPPGLKGLSMRDVLDMVAPEIQLSCLRLAIPGSTTEQQLLKLDQQGLSNHYKVGIMYCKAGQETEEEMYNNEEAGPAFEEFLSLIGQKVRLKNFDKYKAGLDNKMDSTGLYSVYAQHQGCEVMFHVSTLLPFTPNNRQQLLRKRHIGNDIVTIVFQEPGALPFTPKNIRSQFQHVFIIVRVVNPCSERTQYKVAVSRSKEVPVFGPPIPAGATFPKSKTFVDFLLAKVINAEHAAHRSEKFATMATRTRQEYLKDLATNYVTSTTLDSNSKFPILTFTSRKKERLRPKFIPDAVQRGAICWQVLVDDVSSSGRVRQVECLLGISTDSAVLVEETNKECIWAVSSRSVLGWTSSTASLRIFYHQGECITVHGRDSEADEIPEMVTRLTAVTSGCGTRELSLRRNAVGQLGFHVQPDGLITEVEPHGPAWQAGLRQGSRLVEICKVAIATLSHEQMVDLLKTSSAVTVTVLPPLSQDVPRRGCTLQSCSYIVGAADGEYDNINNNSGEPENAGVSNAVQQQQASIHSRRLRYERSVSPPRSSNSSGYGTGSSSRSFSQGPASIARFPSNPEGTLTSTSSGHSSDDPWYDVTVEPIDFDAQTSAKDAKSSTPPPPLPSRQGAAAETAHRVKRITAASSEAAENSASFGPLSIIEILRSNPNEETIAATSSVKATVSKYSTPPPPKPKPVLESPLLVSRASNYEDYKRLQAIINAEAAPQEPFKESSTNKTRPLNPPDYHHAIQSRLAALKSSGLPVDQIPRNSGPSPALTPRSEDELSASSVHSLSPRSGRKLTKSGSNAGTLTPSSCSSRNQSPRLLVEAKLKSASSASSSTGSKGSQRGSSNLQEELLRLITPDYESNGAGSEIDNSVIVTHARPAAVLPKAAAELNDLPDAEVMDWSSLVSAAARAIQGAASSMGSGQDAEETPVRDSDDSLTSWIEDVTEKLGLEAANLSLQEGKSSSEVNATTEFIERMRQLEHHVGSLENRLRSEEDRRQMLEAEIRRLRDDNMRLQGESQSAAQQLKRFTDWFFQTIERP